MTNNGTHPWTAERDAQLRTLFEAVPRLSFMQIGAALGVSRNSAIGRAGRLGLTRGVQFRSGMGWVTTAGTGPKRIRKRRPQMAPKVTPAAGIGAFAKDGPPAEAEPLPPIDAMDAARSTLCDILALNDTTCRYPIDMPNGTMFCGEGVKDGSVYCSFHHSRCRIPRLMAPPRPYFYDRTK